MNSQLQFANNAESTLASGISNTALALTVSAGSGVLFPQLPVSGQTFRATIVDLATGLINEIISVTAVSTDTFTIVRAQEGTTAKNWLAGDIIANLDTAGVAGQYQQANLAPNAITGLTNADVTLNALQTAGGLITLAGVLTGTVHIKFPNSFPGIWQIQNNTTGAHDLFVKTVSGSANIGVPQDGNVYFVISNGTEIISIAYNSIPYVADTSSSTTTYTGGGASVNPANLLVIIFNPNTTNTGASTLNGETIFNNHQQALVAGDFKASSLWLMQFETGVGWFVLVPVASQINAQVSSASVPTTKAGASSTSFITPDSLSGALAFSGNGTLSGQTLVAGATITYTHGLVRAPFMGGIILSCTSADDGYSVGDNVYVPASAFSNTVPHDFGISIRFPTAGTTAQFIVAANGIALINPSTFVLGGLDLTKWSASLLVWG